MQAWANRHLPFQNLWAWAHWALACPFRTGQGLSQMPYGKPYIFGICVGIDIEGIRFLANGQAKVGMPIPITTSVDIHVNPGGFNFANCSN